MAICAPQFTADNSRQQYRLQNLSPPPSLHTTRAASSHGLATPFRPYPRHNDSDADNHSNDEREHNLTSLAAPPISDRAREQSRPTLEESSSSRAAWSSYQNDRGLTSLNAPPRSHRGQDVTRHLTRDSSHLNPVDSKETDYDDDDDADSAAPPPAARQKNNPEEKLESGVSKSDTSTSRGETQKTDHQDRRSHFATQLYIVSYLIFTSFLGVLARLGVQWLTFYPGAPVVISNLWANFGGTLFMGFLQEDRQLFREEWGVSRTFTPGGDEVRDERDIDDARNAAKVAHKKVKKTIPLYIGLTTGFCGTFTSFSTFMRDVFFALANNVPTPINHPSDDSRASETVPRSPGYDFEAILAIILLTMCIAVSALHFGAYVARAFDRWTPTLPFRLIRKYLDPLIVFLALGCWLCVVLLAIWPPDRPGGPTSPGPWSSETWRSSALFALIFAPLGCLLRYWLSLKLNALIPWFPLGTFAANVFGTVVLSVCYDIQHVPFSSRPGMDVGGGLSSCEVLQGLEDGFCGALTTVSTWVVELVTLRTRHAWLYGAISILVGFACTVVIMGSVRWTIGFHEAACFIAYS